MNQYAYCIGGIGINFFLEPPIFLKKEKVSVPFETEPKQGVDLLFHVTEDSFPKDGKICYQDERCIILEVQGQIYRYHGVLDTGGDFLWRSRITLKQESQNVFPVFIHAQSGRKEEKYLTEKQLLTMAGFEYLMVHRKRVILHASLINFQNQGIVFSAPSGTGKSTQADLWKRRYPIVEIINGDRVILSCENGRGMAHGLPFCGTSGIALNCTIPLTAVIILRQARENRVWTPVPLEAIKALLSECAVDIWDTKGMEIVIRLLAEILRTVPVYIYECLPDASAAEFLKLFLEKEGVLQDEKKRRYES